MKSANQLSLIELIQTCNELTPARKARILGKLMGGRRKPTRLEKKRRTRERKVLRKTLVHGAGCVFDGCCMGRSWFIKFWSEWYQADVIRLGVRVPRSLQKMLAIRVAHGIYS